MPPPKQIWFAGGEELGADDISGRGAFTRRYIGINYSPPGASDEPAFTVEHTPQDISGLVVPALKVFAGPFSIGDAILVEKVVQTGNFLAFEYRGDDYFTVAGDGDTWTAGTIEAEKANAGGVEVAADGTVALDLTLANVFTTTTSQNTSWSTSAPPADGLGGQRVSFVVDNAGGHTVAWAAGFTNVDAIGPGDTGISVRTLQFDGSTWHQIAATLDGDAINAGAGDVDGSGTADFIPKWLDADTLTDSIIREIGGEIGIGAAPNEMLTVEGVLSLKEGAAPGNDADYGKIYVKAADSGLYFKEDDGTEHDLLAVGGGVFREVATGNILGPASAGASITTGDYNFVAGFNAYALGTTGSYNVIAGYEAGKSMVAGSSGNIIFGWQAMVDATGNLVDNCIALGTMTLQDCQAGGNIAIGSTAGRKLTTGTYIIAIGLSCMSGAIITGDYSVGMGESCLQGLTSGEYNANYGASSAQNIASGSYNSGFGEHSLYTNPGNRLTGDYNSAFGASAAKFIQGNTNRNLYLGAGAGPPGPGYTQEDDLLYIDNHATLTPLIAGDFAAHTVFVNGTFNATTKTFRIIHPLDSTKYLFHGVIEGPEYGLMYRGKANLKDGKARIDIDVACGMSKGIFEAIAMNPTIYLQNKTGFSAVQHTEVEGAVFEIIAQDTNSNDEISWMVCAERCDKFVMDSVATDDIGHLLLERPMPEEVIEERLAEVA